MIIPIQNKLLKLYNEAKSHLFDSLWICILQHDPTKDEPFFHEIQIHFLRSF